MDPLDLLGGRCRSLHNLEAVPSIGLEGCLDRPDSLGVLRMRPGVMLEGERVTQIQGRAHGAVPYSAFLEGNGAESGRCDVAVVGAGAAGLWVALQAAERGALVMLLSRTPLSE